MTTRTRLDDSSDEEQDITHKRPHITSNNDNLKNIYLDTIQRKILDFDFEKICSVTLSNINIYGCLVCGKYFQGRGKQSPAYSHAVNNDHHVFISFNNLNVYLLPEMELVESHTLDDIKYSVYPTYTPSDLKTLGLSTAVDLNGNTYNPGFIGLNNIKANQYSNVVLQAICHVRTIRNHILLNTDEQLINKNELNKRFNVFIRKLWSSKLFKNHISPHDILQHISVISHNQYTVNQERDPYKFMIWLLNALNQSFAQSKSSSSSSSSIFAKSFQGKIKISSTKLITRENESNTTDFNTSGDIKESITKFWILSLDLPPMPLFKDGLGVQQLPQVKLSKLLEKYNGTTEHIINNEIKKYQILKYPQFLMIHYNRFKDHNLNIDLKVKDRNQTIVEFPLELTFQGNVRYKLTSNIIHDLIQADELNSDDQTNWKIQLRKLNDEWIEVEDLQIIPKEKEFLFLKESYIQIWERIE